MIKHISDLIDDPDPVIIMPYGGFLNNNTIYSQARVLEDEGLEEVKGDSVLSHVVRSFKRFESDEIKEANVQVKWQGGEVKLESDNEGYVYLKEKHGLDLNHSKTLWLPITYNLMSEEKQLFSITTSLMKPSPTSEFGVISDMDETIIQTGLGSTLRWKVIVNTFATDSEDRLPLLGAQELCNLLHGGSTGYSENPFFYLSNSPWNLFDYLSSFLEKYNFPKGPLLLRDIGLENKKRTSLLEGNKYLKTKQILEAYPELNFILIGDAEDSDGEIYLEIARNFPNRILSIYIRKVSSVEKNTFLEQLVEETKDIAIKLIATSEEAIKDARKKGYII